MTTETELPSGQPMHYPTGDQYDIPPTYWRKGLTLDGHIEQIVQEAYAAYGKCKSKTAKALGLSRATIYRYAQMFNLDGQP